MKICYTGAKGQLGKALSVLFLKSNVDATGIDIDEVDLTSKESIDSYFKNKSFDCIIHCAAYTAVDLAESNKELCFKINVEASKTLCDIAKTMNAKFVVISSDYVFDGTKDGIYDVTDKKNPLSVYGESKDLAEEYCKTYSKAFIVRSSWIYGDGKNFVKTMLKLAETKKELSIVSDQVGSPTYAVDLAAFLYQLVQSEKYGVYHATNEGFTSWYEFAKKIFELASVKDMKVNPCLTKDYVCAAKRPLNSRLSKECLTRNGFSLFPTWEDALERYLKTIQ